MAKVLDKATSDAVREHLRFYRELGVWDLYRREIPESLLAQLEAASESAALAEAPIETEVEREDLAKARKAVVELSAASAPVKINAPLPTTTPMDRVSALKVIREDIGE